MDCLLNPRIEHAQSTDWGNPWIAPISRIEWTKCSSMDLGNPWITHIQGLRGLSAQVWIWAINGLPPYPRIESWAIHGLPRLHSIL